MTAPVTIAAAGGDVVSPLTLPELIDAHRKATADLAAAQAEWERLDRASAEDVDRLSAAIEHATMTIRTLTRQIGEYPCQTQADKKAQEAFFVRLDLAGDDTPQMRSMLFSARAARLRQYAMDRFRSAFQSPLNGAVRVDKDRLAESIFREAQGDVDLMEAIAVVGAYAVAEKVERVFRRGRSK